MAYACRTSCARKLVGVIPYLPYCKQSKMRKRGSIVSRLLADMLSKAGEHGTYLSIFDALNCPHSLYIIEERIFENNELIIVS